MKRKSGKKNHVLALLLLSIYLLFQFFVLRLSGRLSQPDVGGRPTQLQGLDAPPEITINLDREVKKGLKYVNSIDSTARKLLFVHIPKTAGTTIEEVGGLQAKLAWGSCLFNHRPKRRGGVWINPYANADLFVVVRDPNDRLLSEFLYLCRKKVTKWADTVECNSTRIHEPEYMNQWLQAKMKRSSATRYQPADYLDLNGHFTPQYDFVVSHGDIRMVDYVLQMNNLQKEFPALMKAYGIKAKMSPHKRNAARNDTRDLEPQHFDDTTRARIQDMYEKDFDLLTKRVA